MAELTGGLWVYIMLVLGPLGRCVSERDMACLQAGALVPRRSRIGMLTPGHLECSLYVVT